MRCRDVSRAIAAPDGTINEAEIEAHLASCPRCSRQAEDRLRLDRLWEATRPALPSSASWDAAWARIDRELAAPEPSRPMPMPARAIAGRLPIRLAAGFVLTAAAAIVLALNLPDPAPPSTAQADSIRRTFEVPVGQTVLYHVDSGDRRVIRVNEPSPDAELTSFDIADDYFALFNWFEAMPELMASAFDDSGSPFGTLSQ